MGFYSLVEDFSLVWKEKKTYELDYVDSQVHFLRLRDEEVLGLQKNKLWNQHMIHYTLIKYISTC